MSSLPRCPLNRSSRVFSISLSCRRSGEVAPLTPTPPMFRRQTEPLPERSVSRRSDAFSRFMKSRMHEAPCRLYRHTTRPFSNQGLMLGWVVERLPLNLRNSNHRQCLRSPRSQPSTHASAIRTNDAELSLVRFLAKPECWSHGSRRTSILVTAARAKPEAVTTSFKAPQSFYRPPPFVLPAAIN